MQPIALWRCLASARCWRARKCSSTAQQHAPPPLRRYLPVALIKLMLHPLLVLLVGVAAIQWGLAMDRYTECGDCVGHSAAQRQQCRCWPSALLRGQRSIARIIIVSTVVAF